MPRDTDDRTTVLCFHGVGAAGAATDDDERDYWISPSAFLSVLDLVAGRPDVELTFDDGFASDVEVALPALTERGLVASFFPVVGRLGEPGFVDEDGVRSLAEAGMDLGTHGMTHRVWVDCSDEELTVELERSRSVLADLVGRPVLAAACPLGRYDRRVLRVVRDLGFHTVYTSDRAVVRDGSWLRPRFSVREFDSVADVAAILDRRPSVGRDGLDALRLLAKRHRRGVGLPRAQQP